METTIHFKSLVNSSWAIRVDKIETCRRKSLIEVSAMRTGSLKFQRLEQGLLKQEINTKRKTPYLFIRRKIWIYWSKSCTFCFSKFKQKVKSPKIRKTPIHEVTGVVILFFNNNFNNKVDKISFHLINLFVCLFRLFKSQVNSYVVAGRSVHLTTLYWASLNKQFTSTSCTFFCL